MKCINFQNRYKTEDNCCTLLFVFGALVDASSEKFMQPKNGAGQVDFSSTCLTGQVGNKVNVKLCLVTLLTHMETEYM